MAIRIIEEEDIEITQEEYDRYYHEYTNSMQYHVCPPSFEAWLRRRLHKDDGKQSTNAPTALINIVDNGKVVIFDPSEFSYIDVTTDPMVQYQKAIEQYGQASYWLSKQRKRLRAAQAEFSAYSGRLYHQLKAEGGYLSKYRGTRCTEDGVKQALWEDKGYRELTQNEYDLQEVCDQLWGLQKTVEHKLYALKEMCTMIKANRYAEGQENRHA